MNSTEEISACRKRAPQDGDAYLCSKRMLQNKDGALETIIRDFLKALKSEMEAQVGYGQIWMDYPAYKQDMSYLLLLAHMEGITIRLHMWQPSLFDESSIML
jgi:hypothetical protein